ncbi:nicotinate (nicotinamide) nucleotide adenylyltransferase [Hungatella hathewayi]|uniref:nicotinate (nicotinamide) nucleotide adenylyltransferase n=1 Tax=Hungatella hathewayi TaxID=154046 RepID=UPI00356414F1
MERTIVIIGGSFNPPTNAHMMLAEITKKKINASYVLFVPAKISYMMEWKKYQNSDILSDDIRMQALESLENEWLKIERCELDGVVSGTSYETLNYIKNKYQTQWVYFAIGSDKLEEIPRWYNSEQLLKENKFIVIQRNHDDIQQILKESAFLKSHKESFIICDESDDSTQQISSTRVREEMCKGDYDEIIKMVPDSVYHIITNNINIQKQDE